MRPADVLEDLNTTLCVPPVGEPELYPVAFTSSWYGRLHESGIFATLTKPSRVWVRYAVSACTSG